jgi:hypothetical protein
MYFADRSIANTACEILGDPTSSIPTARPPNYWHLAAETHVLGPISTEILDINQSSTYDRGLMCNAASRIDPALL